MRTCFNYDSFDEFKKEIEICRKMLQGDFREYFSTYYTPNRTLRVGRIFLPESLKEKIKEKTSLIQVIQQYLEHNEKEPIERKKLGLQLFLEGECGGQLNFFFNSPLVEFYWEVEDTRKLLLKKLDSLVQNTLVYLNEIIEYYEGKDNAEEQREIELIAEE